MSIPQSGHNGQKGFIELAGVVENAFAQFVKIPVNNRFIGVLNVAAAEDLVAVA